MEARAGLDVVVVVVRDIEARGVHRESPEAEQVHLLAQLQRRGGQDKAGADALGAHPQAEPVARHVDQVLRVEVVDGLRRLEVIQHVLDADGHVGVARVVEGRQQYGRVLVHLQHPVEGPPPLLQLVEPGGGLRVRGRVPGALAPPSPPPPLHPGVFSKEERDSQGQPHLPSSHSANECPPSSETVIFC